MGAVLRVFRPNRRHNRVITLGFGLVEPFGESQSGGDHRDDGEADQVKQVSKHLGEHCVAQHDAAGQSNKVRIRQYFAYVLGKRWHAIEREHES